MPVIIKYLLVYALSGFKFILGPTLGISYGFTVVETAVLTTLGMMTTVYVLTYFGHQIRSLSIRIFGVKKRQNFTPKRRRFVRIWKRYGVQGIAFLTPLLLTPVGGPLLANALGARKSDIFKWMWIFGGFWAFVLTILVKYAAGILREFNLI